MAKNVDSTPMKETKDGKEFKEEGHPHLKSAISAVEGLRQRIRPKGGEGVRRLVRHREAAPGCLGGDRNDYWLTSVLAIRGRALPAIPLFIYTVYSTLVVAAMVEGVDNYKKVTQLTGLQFPLQTLGLALFLLLVFRTNSCYDRWWEGRKLWDAMNSKCQDQGRLATAWLGKKKPEATAQLIRWTLAFVVVAKQTLRFDPDLSELDDILTKEQLQQLKAGNSPMSYVAYSMTNVITQLAESAAVPIPIYNAMDTNMRGLLTDYNACLRIVNTPMPFAYIVHLRSFMMLWLAGLPFAFVVNMGYYSILVCVVIGYQVLGFEDIGVEIESPFGYDYNDLPVNTIAYEIGNSLLDMMACLPGHSNLSRESNPIKPPAAGAPESDPVPAAPMAAAPGGLEEV